MSGPFVRQDDQDTVGDKSGPGINATPDSIAALFNAAIDAVVGMDSSGRVIAWNTQAVATFGWSREAALGRQLADLIVPEPLRTAHRKGLKHYLKTGKGPVLNRRIEVTALNRDGAEFPVELSIIPISSNGGTIFYGFLRDISTQKRNEERLARAAARDRIMFEIARLTAEPGEFNQLLMACVERICTLAGWPVGHIYLPDRAENPRFFLSTDIWFLRSEKFASIRDNKQAEILERGEGLPGMIWERNEPLWIPDLTQDETFLRRDDFKKVGLLSGFGFPIVHGDTILAILEFFSEDSREPEEELLLTMERIGAHLGRVIERQRAYEQTQTMVRELAHRIGNMLAIISAVFQQSTRHTDSIEELKQKFTARLQAMKSVQMNLVHSNWELTDFDRMIESILEPYITAGETDYRLNGPSLTLDSSQAMSLSLVINELAANAVKHGSLSAGNGRLEVNWKLKAARTNARQLVVNWLETGGPPANKPKRIGFGTDLIKRMIERGMGGKIHTEYGERGLSVEMVIPL